MNGASKSSASPTRSRRRGARLEADIFDAALAELRAVGYGALTFDRIAQRARVGRMSLYHRWPGKPQLVAAMLRHVLPPLPAHSEPGTGDLRDDLCILLASMFQASGEPAIALVDIATSLLAETADEELAVVVREEILGERLARLEEVIEGARRRGEINPAANTSLLARCGPALLFQQLLLSGRLPVSGDVVKVVDQLILPAAQPGQGSTARK